MTTNAAQQTCFNCRRTDDEIPILQFSYQQRPFTVCSECMPQLIHKWAQIAPALNQQPTGKSSE